MSKSLGNVVDPLDVMTGKDLAAMAKQLEGSGLNSAELDKAREGQRISFPQVRIISTWSWHRSMVFVDKFPQR